MSTLVNISNLIRFLLRFLIHSYGVINTDVEGAYMPTTANAGASPATGSGTIRPNMAGLRDRVSETRDLLEANSTALRDGVQDAGAQVYLFRKGLESEYMRETTADATRVEAAITSTFNAVVAAAVTLIVGIYVFSQISDTMPTPENQDLANATETVESTTGDAFTLGAVAVIVLVAALILSLIGSGFGNGGGRRLR